MRNTGKKSEDIFKEKIEAHYKKKAFLFRIPDTHDASRGGKVRVTLSNTPADYILTWPEGTGYAEVKSTSGKTSFPFSSFTTGQNKAMVRQKAAGGNYWVFIHRLETDEWFRLSGEDVLNSSKKSITWKELETHKWAL